MKHLLLIATLTLAACGPHVIPPKGQGYVEVDRAGGGIPPAVGPDRFDNGGDSSGGSSDDNGDVSDE